MVITKVIWLYNIEWQYYHGMAVNYRGKKFYNIGPWNIQIVYLDMENNFSLVWYLWWRSMSGPYFVKAPRFYHKYDTCLKYLSAPDTLAY